jgi:hypothetical protein
MGGGGEQGLGEGGVNLRSPGAGPEGGQHGGQTRPWLGAAKRVGLCTTQYPGDDSGLARRRCENDLEGVNRPKT